jgi:hypothetical protein
MNPKLKRFLIILSIATVINFPLFFFLEADRNCVLEWGSKCSTSFLLRIASQTIFISALFYYLGGKRTVGKKQV